VEDDTTILKGMRLLFLGKRIYTALVVETHQNQPTLYDAKEIHQILDESPIA
jgi:primosomal protein N' (replication factor Y)